MNRALFKRPALICLAVLLVAQSGCRPKSEKTKAVLVDQPGTYGGPDAARLRLDKNGKPVTVKQTELPGKVRGTGWHIPWYAPDPKNPDGPLQPVLIADAQQGSMDYKTDSKQGNNNKQNNTQQNDRRNKNSDSGKPDSKKDILTIYLHTVTATLYQDGKPSAHFEAPQVTTNERDRILIATGGVTIHSVIDPTADPKRTASHKEPPADTTVTAAKMVWDSHTTTVVCTGSALLIMKRPDQPDIIQRSDKIIYNTETREFQAVNLTR